MRFLKKNKTDKIILCVSDLHLGAGNFYEGRKNNLEDFNYDKEFVEFLEFYSSGGYQKVEVELIINGDFLDFLAVPFVEYFDDEFWSQEASLEKLKIIMNAHKEVFESLKKFSDQKNKTLTYLVGNHDAEVELHHCRNYLFDYFNQKINIIELCSNGYFPIASIQVAHGHQEERANQFDEESIQTDESGREYLIPPWGSYYVSKVVNRFKSEKAHMNSVRPIKKFIIDGLIYDSFDTLRFLAATIYYYVIVRFIFIFKQGHVKDGLINLIKEEFDVFNAPEEQKYEALLEKKGLKVYLQGHTHKPEITFFSKTKVFINTGTWTDMYQLDFGRSRENEMLTYAKIEVLSPNTVNEKLNSNLLVWKGVDKNPFVEF